MSSSIQFDTYGRMRYHPEFHPNQGRYWTTVDQQFLIDNYARIGPEECSLALGRTIHTVMQKAYSLRQAELMPRAVRKSHFRRLIRRGLC